MDLRDRYKMLPDHRCIILQNDSILKQMQSLFVSSGMQNGSCTEVQSELYNALDQQYITKEEFQDTYDHAGRTRAAVRGFIKYLLNCKQYQQKS